MLGIYGMGMGGTVIAGLTAPWMAKHWGLAAPFWVAFGIVALMAAAFALLARDAPGSTTRASSLLAPLRVVHEDPRVWAPTFYYFILFGGFVAMFAYLPKLLHSVHHLSKTDAGARAAGFALLAVLARPLGGWLSDRIGPTAVLRVALGATVILAIGLALGYRSMDWITVCCLTVAVAFGLGTGAVFRLVAHDFPERIGAVTGIVGAAGGLGGFFPPLVMAWDKTQYQSYELGFLALAVTAFAAIVVLELMHRGERSREARSAVIPDS